MAVISSSSETEDSTPSRIQTADDARVRLTVVLSGVTKRLRNPQVWLYVISIGFVVGSYLIWFKFSAPPIGSNTTFDLYPWRQVQLSLSLFDPYYWPGSFVPQAYGTPYEAFYGSWYSLSGNSYAIATFLTIVSVDAGAGACLFYLASRWLVARGISQSYGLFAVLVYSFNVYKTLSGYGTYAGYFSVGPFSAGDPAFLIILGFLAYLALFKNRWYAIGLGLVSFLAFSYFPTSTLTIGEEFIVVLAVLLWYRWACIPSAGPVRSEIRRVLLDGSAIVGCILVANAYLILPFILTGQTYTTALAASNPTYTYSFAFDAIETPTNAIRLISNWWIATPGAPSWVGPYLGDPASILLTWALPILALGSILFLRRTLDRVLYCCMIVTVLASTGPNGAFGPVFVGAITSVPLLRPFFNAEYFSAILTVLYGLFLSLTVAEVGKLLSKWRISGPSLQTHLNHQRPLLGALSSRGFSLKEASFAMLVAAVLLASSYPALTPSYSDGSPGYPSSSTLPNYYQHASDYLSSANPDAPVMVFPAVSSFTSLAQSNSTWYTGLNTYSSIIDNPSISSSYPSNYWGTTSTTLPIPNFVYSAIGARACPIDSCFSQYTNLIPQLRLIREGETANLVSGNQSQVNWQSGTSGDTLSFSIAPTSISMIFDVNTSNYIPGGHWALGFFPSPTNFSADSYALVTLSSFGVDLNHLEFGFHSGTNFGSGNAYILGGAMQVNESGSDTFLIPLDFPSIDSRGDLSNVTNFFFVYQPLQNETGIATIVVHSIRLSSYGGPLPTDWEPAFAVDQSTLVSTAGNTTLHFSINESAYEPNAHWVTGTFPAPVNLSAYSFAVLNYTVVGLDPEYLQWGYHTISGASGEAFSPNDFVTSQAGEEQTTVIDLTQPSVQGGGSLSHVSDVFFNYDPPQATLGIGYLNVSSIELVSGVPGGVLLASDLARIGVEYVYVDTGITDSLTPTRVGTYYDGVFSSSRAFEKVFSEGTVTIYLNTLCSGLISATGEVSLVPSVPGTLGKESFPFLGIYDNSSNLGVTYLSSAVEPPSGALGDANVTSISVLSATDYTATIRALDWSVLTLRLSYDQRWVATVEGGPELGDHVMVDGFANGWLAPPGNYTVLFELAGQRVYQALELVAFLTVPFLVVLMAAIWLRQRLRKRARSVGSILRAFLGHNSRGTDPR